MTDRIAGYVVTLAEDMRDDDAEAVLIALRQVRGVISVEPVKSDAALLIATERVRTEYYTKLWHAMREVLG